MSNVCYAVNRAYVNGATWPGYSAAQLKIPQLYPILSPYGGPLPNATAAGSAVLPFVSQYGSVVELLINNTDGGEHPIRA